MQQIVQDSTKSAFIQAVVAGLADNPRLAMQAVVKLSNVLPVYLNTIPEMGAGVEAFVAYMMGGPMPEWFKHASQA